jgi:Family of unknown function (DUF6370)
MRKILLLFSFLFISILMVAQSKRTVGKINDQQPVLEMEAGCGMCMFGVKDNDCRLTLKKNEKTYYVKGTDIDDHGDAHADDGFCNATRRARVQGSFSGDTLVVSYFELIHNSVKKKKG